MGFASIFTIVFIFSWMVAFANQKLLVTVPVANVLVDPTEDYEGKVAPVIHANRVKNLKTQVLFNELVELKEKHNGWLRVKLLEQTESITSGNSCVDGWVSASVVTEAANIPEYNVVVTTNLAPLYRQANANSKILLNLSAGTKFVGKQVAYKWWEVELPNGSKAFLKDGHIFYFNSEIENEHDLRVMLVRAARKMKGAPFCWYGRSSYNARDKKQLTSIGCDGLIDLIYRCCGLLIPRFAQHQYDQGEPINGNQLKPGDLIFYATLNGDAHHSMIYMGNNDLLEATFQSEGPIFPARIISATDRLRKPVSNIKDQEVLYGRYRVCFCSYVSNLLTLKRMRKAARSSW